MTRRFLFFALLPVLPVLLALEAGAASLQFSSPNGEAVPMTAPDIEVQLGLEEGVLYGRHRPCGAARFRRSAVQRRGRGCRL